MTNRKNNWFSILVSSLGDNIDLSKDAPKEERKSERRNILGVIQEWYPDRDWNVVDVKVIDCRDGGKHAKL